jgi:hypothetical protein
MMVKSGMEKLLGEVLAFHDEDGRGADLTEERARDVLLGHDVFRRDEERLLATSPLARSTYAEVQEDLRLEEEAFLTRCRRAGIETEIVFPLAASGGEDPPELSNADFSIRLRSRPISEGWVISLTLSDRFRKIMHSDGWLIVVDDQGVTWLRGQVNSYGEIHSYSLPGGEDPAKTVRRKGFKLRVRPG